MAKVIGNNHKKPVEKRQQARYRKKYLKKIVTPNRSKRKMTTTDNAENPIS